MKKKKLGTGAIIGIVILVILSVASAFANIYSGLFTNPKFITPGAIAEIVTFLILLIGVIYYAIRNYKVPHGNLLRWLFFLFSLNCLGIMAEEIVGGYRFGLMEKNMGEVMLLVMLLAVSAILATFISGRLDHLRGNIACIIVITIAQLVKSIILQTQFGPNYDVLLIMSNFSTFILWIDMAFAYIIRYKPHKEAGLTDK